MGGGGGVERECSKKKKKKRMLHRANREGNRASDRIKIEIFWRRERQQNEDGRGTNSFDRVFTAWHVRLHGVRKSSDISPPVMGIQIL